VIPLRWLGAFWFLSVRSAKQLVFQLVLRCEFLKFFVPIFDLSGSLSLVLTTEANVVAVEGLVLVEEPATRGDAAEKMPTMMISFGCSGLFST
jgi:hypothetical protein